MNQSNKINPYSPTIAALLIAGLLLLGTFISYGLFALMNRLMSPGQSSPDIPTMPVAPIIFLPTPDCGAPTLVLGSATFQIQNLTRAPDGTLNVPTGTSEVAYWVEGTDRNYVFVLGPTPDNLSLLSTLTAGSEATATWSNCNSTSYSLSAPEPNSPALSTLPDQSVEGVTIFVQADPSGNGILIRGELAGQQMSVINTPDPETSEVQAEISLLETSVSSDEASVVISISILNYGGSTITFSETDITLMTQDGTMVIMQASDPRLPENIKPGKTKIFQVTFARPASPTAVLRIFSVEYDIEGY